MCTTMSAISPLSGPLLRAQLEGVETSLPATVPNAYTEDEPFLQSLHHVLLEIEILEGQLICPETSKRFPVKDGIPSML